MVAEAATPRWGKLARQLGIGHQAHPGTPAVTAAVVGEGHGAFAVGLDFDDVDGPVPGLDVTRCVDFAGEPAVAFVADIAGGGAGADETEGGDGVAGGVAELG